MAKDLAHATLTRVNDNRTNQQYLTLKRADRHGLIAEAANTGKTVTLQNLAEFAEEQAANRGRGHCRSRRSDAVIGVVAKSTARSAINSGSRELVPGLLGMLQ